MRRVLATFCAVSRPGVVPTQRCPPLPPAGKIMWVRQLMRVIEEPMTLFAQNKPLLALRESKRIIRHYNRVGDCFGGGSRQLLLPSGVWRHARGCAFGLC